MRDHNEYIDETDPAFLADVEAEVYRMRVREAAARRYRERYGTVPTLVAGLAPAAGAGSVLARPQQAALHEYLRENGPTHVGAIATDLGRTRTAIRQGVNRLVRAGFARQCAAPLGYEGPAHTRWIEALGEFPDQRIADPSAADCETVAAIRDLCVMRGSTYAAEVARLLGVTSSTMAGRIERLTGRGVLCDAPPEARVGDRPHGVRLIWFAESSGSVAGICGAES